MKPSTEPSHAELGNVAHLFQALHCLRAGSLPFPARVLESGGRWFVPLHELGPRTFLEFQKTARQHGWDAKTVVGLPKDSREVPLASLLGGQWRYVDPLTARNGHGRMGDAPYLLAARDEAHAGHLLRLLTSSLVRGIAARPVLFTEGKHPFAFLWAVTRGEPPLTLLQSAETAWWHPLRNSRGLVVYREWPYELGAVDDGILERIDWEGPGGLVLLRHDREPVVVQIPAVEPLLADLADVAGFEATRCPPASPTVIASTPAERSPCRFQVSLRLVEEPPKHTQARRITALKAEIQAKQSLLELLEEASGGAALGGRWIAPEPLFLFYEEPGTVPFQLRRLLVEWVDQEKGLGDLRYQKLSPASLPPDLVPAGEPVEVHLLTTARALGEDSPGLLGHRLRDYRPSQGRTFDLLTDWAGHGLRLFLPQGRHLALYPEMRATPLAAAKLARALLPGAAGTADPRGEWCALLLQVEEGRRLQAIPLRRDGFLPLTRAFEWDCALDVSSSPAEKAPKLAGTLAERLFATADQALQELVKDAVSSGLGERQKAAAEELAARTREISELEARLSTARSQLAGLTAAASSFEAERKSLLQGLEILLPELAAEVSGMQALLAELTGALETVYRERESLLRSLEAVIRGTTRVIGRLQRLVALVERLLGLTQETSALAQRWETLLKLSGASAKP